MQHRRQGEVSVIQERPGYKTICPAQEKYNSKTRKMCTTDTVTQGDYPRSKISCDHTGNGFFHDEGTQGFLSHTSTEGSDLEILVKRCPSKGTKLC